MATKIYQVDAFTNIAFKGNPAAVCLLDEPRNDAWMQSVAGEMNLSETAFLSPQEDGYSLRWFTPLDEVDLCGHATLASAHVLWELGLLGGRETARFFTKSGLLTAEKKDEWIEMNFPSEPPVALDAPMYLLEGLGLDAGSVRYVGKNRMDYLVEVDRTELLEALQPNWSVLERVATRGIIVTSAVTERINLPGVCQVESRVEPQASFDFISRAFFPKIGVPEDPVTGSAHSCLGPYWAAKFNKSEMLAYQASKRGGVIRVAMQGERVLLGGQAVTVLRGELS